MATNKAIWVTATNFKVGISKIGNWGSSTGTIPQIVHDGDTVSTLLNKNLSVRFLGIDTPEVSFQLPGETDFTSISNQKWEDLFTSGNWRSAFSADPNLLNYLAVIIGDGIGVAKNHASLADKAQKALENIINGDLTLSGKAKGDFDFFMAFANDIFDTYARLLCYINSSKYNYSTTTDQDTIEAKSYNERMLENGMASPYFIWPNVQPFLNIKPLARENIDPNTFWIMITHANKLYRSRQFVKNARQNNLGIFDAAEPLRLAPHELRFIARKKAPDRYVVDLTKPFTNQILRPEKYYTIPFAEDRLYIPPEYIPIFQMYGWVVV